jgi:hypothetical protein
MSVALKRKAAAADGTPGAFIAEIFDDGHKAIEGVTPVEALRRNAEVVPILSCGGVWIVDGKFGVTWTLHQAVIKVPGEGGSSRGFLGVEEEEDSTVVTAADEDLMAAVMPAAKTTTKFPAAAADDEDDDEDDDDDEDHTEEAPPVPTPAPRKATTVAAAAPAPAKAPAKVGKVSKVAK